ncbi:MAG: ATP-binding cassette domain-containing protein [Acidiphilium sp.]
MGSANSIQTQLRHMNAGDSNGFCCSSVRPIIISCCALDPSAPARGLRSHRLTPIDPTTRHHRPDDLGDLTVISAWGRGGSAPSSSPTGCGKSTTLTLTAGLERPSAGTVHVFGKPVDGLTGGAGFVFQNDALMPWKSVIDNVALILLCHKFIGYCRALAARASGQGSSDGAGDGDTNGCD